MHRGSLVRTALTRVGSLSSARRTLRPAPSRPPSAIAPRAVAMSFGTADGAPYGFSSSFDSGNGELVSATEHTLTVRMREEPFTVADGRAHFQWFHFRVTGARGRTRPVTARAPTMVPLKHVTCNLSRVACNVQLVPRSLITRRL